jgi:hypothetical protein
MRRHLARHCHHRAGEAHLTYYLKARLSRVPDGTRGQWYSLGDSKRFNGIPGPRGGYCRWLPVCLDRKPDLTAKSVGFALETTGDSKIAQEIIRRESVMHVSIDMQLHQYNKRWLVPLLPPDQRLVDGFSFVRG